MKRVGASEERVSESTVRELAAYLDGELSPSAAKHIEVRLKESAALRGCLAELQQIDRGLAAPLARESADEVVARLRQQFSAEATRPSPERGRPGLGGPLWLAAAAVGVSLPALWMRTPEEGPEVEYRTKGAATSGAELRWQGLKFYRAGDDTLPQALSAEVGVADQLLFAYTNIGERPYSHLMVFALSDSQELIWFYPSATGGDARSVPIEVGAETLLPDAIRPGWRPGRWRVGALFSRRPLAAGGVARRLAEGRLSEPSRKDEALHLYVVRVTEDE